jgi:hypothetical protein
MSFLFPTEESPTMLTPFATGSQCDVAGSVGISIDDAYDQQIAGIRDINLDSLINDADARAIANVVRRSEAIRLMAR